MNKQAGFTLLEVMVVVVIVAILAAVAYPSYSDYTRRGKIAEAIATLADARAKMEQFYLDNRTYVGSDAANMPCDPAVLNAGKKSFTYACDPPTLNTYRVVATGAGGDGMGAFQYTINQANVRTSTVTGLSGWSGSATCWVTKKGGVC
jgi:type IV pilus assembly protein PilE